MSVVRQVKYYAMLLTWCDDIQIHQLLYTAKYVAFVNIDDMNECGYVYFAFERSKDDIVGLTTLKRVFVVLFNGRTPIFSASLDFLDWRFSFTF